MIILAKELRERYFSKEARLLYDVTSKSELINRIISVLNLYVPEDINRIDSFAFNFNKTFPLNNTEIYGHYKSFYIIMQL